MATFRRPGDGDPFVAWRTALSPFRVPFSFFYMHVIPSDTSLTPPYAA
jgi:hypothetical protein